MEKNNKAVTILLPVIAVIIIFESITLVSKLENNQSTSAVNQVATTIPTVTEEKKDVLDLVFDTDSKEMEIGKKYTVKLQGYIKEKKVVDSLEIAIKFDAENFEISNFVYDSNLNKPVVSTVVKNNGMIIVKYLIENKSGLTLNEGDTLPLLTFSVKPIKAGNYNFEIATGNEGKEFVTMFVENTTVKALSFSSNKLEVNVIDKK